MFFDLTPREKKELEALEEAYAKLLSDAEEKVDALRPSDPDPDPKKLEAIAKKKKALYAKRPPELDDIEKYHNSKAYKEWYAKVKPLEDESQKIIDEWFLAGSEEWYAARAELFKLEENLAKARSDFFDRARKRYVASLGNDPEKVYQDACKQVVELIVRPYYAYENDIKVSDEWSAYDVRVQPDGGFRLDVEETRKRITADLEPYFVVLRAVDGYADRLTAYIDHALKASPYVSSEGVLFGAVKNKKPQKEDNVLVKRPTDYVTTVDRVSRLVFGNIKSEKGLIKPIDATDEATFGVSLNRSGSVRVRVAIDYKDLLASGEIAQIPKLTEKDYNVHDAIITLLNAGNRTMTYDMIYRAMTGKVSGKVDVPDSAKETIDDALAKFRGVLKLKYQYKNDHDETVTRYFDEPLVSYQRVKDVKVNGKIISGAIRLADDTKLDPPLLKWARLNGNEIDTRDITLLDVPRLNNSDESFIIKMCLYRRIISMRSAFGRVKKGRTELAENERTIRYDFIYKELGLDGDALTKDKRHDIKDKIDKCLKYWASRNDPITGYEHKKSGGAYYAVVLSFMPKA